MYIWLFNDRFSLSRFGGEAQFSENAPNLHVPKHFAFKCVLANGWRCDGNASRRLHEWASGEPGTARKKTTRIIGFIVRTTVSVVVVVVAVAVM